MSLRAIVAALGGDLYDGGRRASIPAPGHSAQDRSVSLLWSRGRVVVHSFGAADWREVLQHLRAKGLIGSSSTWVEDAPPRPAGQRVSVARALWASARPLEDTLGERHLRLRRIRRSLPAALRFHPQAPIAVYRVSSASRPAMLAAITDIADSLVGVEVTYLDPSGRRTTSLRLPRKTVGATPPGSAVRLDDVGPEMLVAEGVATALSASEQFGLPAWALLGVHNLAGWSPPAVVRRVVIAADRGRPGEAAAAKLAHRLEACGLDPQVALPPPGFDDWNEAAPKGEARAGKAAP